MADRARALRRTTLGGPLSGSGANTRMSAGRKSLGGPKTRMSLLGKQQQAAARLSVSSSRMSLGGGGAGLSSALRRSSTASSGRPSSVRKSSTRRSSVFGSGAGGGGRNDPRAVTDKQYMAASIRHLCDFLDERSYDCSVSPKLLAKPTGKDFQNIVEFLFRHVDPHFEDKEFRTNAKFDDRVISMFKGLKYPFALSKMGLGAVGTPHTWPPLLAALMWVVELLSYDAEAEAVRADAGGLSGPCLRDEGDAADDPAAEGDRAFFMYLAQAYTAFLSGDDATSDRLELELQQALSMHAGDVDAQVASLEASNATLRVKIEAAEKSAKQLPYLEQQQASYESDRVKFAQLLDQLEGHKAMLSDKVSSRTHELERSAETLASLRQSVAGLQRKVAGQGVSPADVAHMRAEKARVQQGLEEASTYRQSMLKDQWASELELTHGVDELERKVHAYNTKAQALHLTPATAKNAGGSDLALKVHKEHCEVSAAEAASATPLAGAAAKALLTPSPAEVVVPALGRLKEALAAQMEEARQELLRLLDEEERSEEEMADAQEALEVLQMKCGKLDDVHAREKQELEAGLADRAAELATLEQDLAEARDPSTREARAADGRRKVSALRSRLEAQRDEFAREKARLHAQVLGALNAAADHKDAVSGSLTALRARSAAALERVEAANAVLLARKADAEAARPGLGVGDVALEL